MCIIYKEIIFKFLARNELLLFFMALGKERLVPTDIDNTIT